MNKKYPEFEGGEIVLREGRGGWSGSQDDNRNGEWVYTLSPHRIGARFLRSTVEVTDGLAEVWLNCFGPALVPRRWLPFPRAAATCQTGP